MGFLKGLASRTKYYVDNTGIHGLRYITEPGRHLTERIFWIGACTLALYATYNLFLATWYNFQHNAVNFGVETAYLEWDTTFPSITVCEHEAPDKIFDAGSMCIANARMVYVFLLSESMELSGIVNGIVERRQKFKHNRLYGEDRNMNLDFFVRDIAFFDGTCNSCSVHCGITVNCTEDFDSVVSNVRAPCTDLVGDCSWNGAAFNCCLHFMPLQTEIGVCYSLNSMHTTPNKEVEKLALISNKQTGPGKLELSVYEATKLFIHSSEDVPNLNHPQEEKVILNWGVILDMVIHVVEIENDPTLNQVSVEQRNCRFPTENILQTYEHYSYSACVVDCRAAVLIKLCNCTHHFIPKIRGVKVCDIAGLACITKHAEMLRALKPKGSPKKGLECECMSSCSEPEYTVISKNSEADEKIEGSRISVSMDALPAQRFKRNVVRTQLDLVVSLGSIAGLFLGASILSTAEWVYYMFIRRMETPKEAKTDKDEGHHTTSARTCISTGLSGMKEMARYERMNAKLKLNHAGKPIYPFMR